MRRTPVALNVYDGRMRHIIRFWPILIFLALQLAVALLWGLGESISTERQRAATMGGTR